MISQTKKFLIPIYKFIRNPSTFRRSSKILERKIGSLLIGTANGQNYKELPFFNL